MAGRLADRLAQMRSIREAQSGGAEAGRGGEQGPASPPVSDHKPQGADAPSLHGGVFEEWEREAPLVLRRSVLRPFSRAGFSGGRVEPLCPYEGLLLPADRLSGSVFYDFETTGLSGGAGTYIFLAGIGRLAEGGLRIDQLFLEDYPGEPDFLLALRRLFGPEETCISYNGKRFDANLLLTRSRMSGIEVHMGPQLDLLYPARRIWKQALESCRLSRVERFVLDRGREDDIEGALIPDCYFGYLRGQQGGGETAEGGPGSCMGRVIDHHLRDIESLAHLLFHIEAAAREPERLALPGSREGMALLMLKRGNPGGIELLEESLAGGSLRAGRIAALHHRRNGSLADLKRVLLAMWERERGLFQGVALAKLYEHRLGSLAAALEIVDELERRHRFLPAATGEELHKRRLRLERKLRGKRGLGGGPAAERRAGDKSAGGR